MSLATPLNPAQLALEVSWLTFEGAEKLNVVSSLVTVFHRDGAGVRVTDLAPQALANDAGTGTWRYIWAAPPLATAGLFVVEYHATDADGIVGVVREDLVVLALDAQVDTVLDCLLGRQKLDKNTNTWTIYRRNGTILKQFDVTDDLGAPSVEDVFEREPI